MASHVSEQPAAAPGRAPGALEERLSDLEERVATLTEAVGVLARGLEDLPSAEPGDNRRAEAARRAHDLLLAAGHGRRRPS